MCYDLCYGKPGKSRGKTTGGGDGLCYPLCYAKTRTKPENTNEPKGLGPH